ncbi:MAG: hypothetical protein KAJ73_00235 [Zetaproteobacteria bacterium]|nr:hypothetical protein [Zetaproteobacteria bacterium]
MAQRPPRRQTSPNDLMDLFNAVLPGDLMSMIAQQMVDHVDEETTSEQATVNVPLGRATQEEIEDTAAGLMAAQMAGEIDQWVLDQALEEEQLLNGSGSEQTNVGTINLPEDMPKRKIKTKTGDVVVRTPEGFPLGMDVEALLAIPGFTEEQRQQIASLGSTNKEHAESLLKIQAHAEEESNKNKRIKIRRGGTEDLHAVGLKEGYEKGRKEGHERGYKEGQDVERRGRYIEQEEVRMGTTDDIAETTIPVNRHHSAAPPHLRDDRNSVRDVTCHVENQQHRRAYLVSVEYPYYQDPGSRPERKYVTAEIPQGLIQDAVVGSTGIVQSLMPVAHRMYDTLTISMSGLEALSHTRAIMSVVLQTVTNQAAVSHRLSPEAIGSLYDLMYAVGQSKGFQVEDIELALHSQG